MEVSASTEGAVAMHGITRDIICISLVLVLHSLRSGRVVFIVHPA